MKILLDYQAGRAAGLRPRPAQTASLLLLPRGEFNLVIATLALLAEGGALVAQVAVVTVLISIPLGTILVRYAPDLSALFERGAAQGRADPRSRSPDTPPDSRITDA